MTQPTLAEKVKGKGRHYRDPDTGELYPSVTNCLKVIDKPALMWWLCKGALSAAWEDREAFSRMRDRDQAVNAYKSAAYKQANHKADLGTDIHDICDALATDNPLPTVSSEAEPYVDQFLSWVSDFDVDIELSERTVINRTVGYGGTFDLIGTFPQARLLVDIKTGKGVYEEAALQLAALVHAERLCLPDGSGTGPAPQVDGAAVLHLQQDGYRLVPVDTSADTFEAFVGAVQLWRFVKGGGSDGALRPPMEVPA